MAAVAVGLALLLAACSSNSTGAAGSTSPGGASSSSSGASSAGVAAAKAELASVEQRPTDIGLSTPVGKPIPTGEKVTWINCGTPSCQIQGQVAQEAGSILGWHVTTINTNGTPQQIQAAWEQALQEKTNGILLTAVPNDEIQSQINQAQQAGVAYVGCCVVDTPGVGGLDFVALTPAENEVTGQIMAAAVVASGGTKANTLYVDLPAFPILTTLDEKFTSSYKQYCPACQLSTLDVPVTALGENATSMIVTYLRSHPTVNYVVLSVDSAFSTGLPTALAQAGLAGKVQFVGEGPDTTSLQYISAGQQLGTVNTDYYTLTFQMMDALARKFAGVPVLQDNTLPWWWLNKSNLPSATTIEPSVAAYEAEFKKLWGK